LKNEANSLKQDLVRLSEFYVESKGNFASDSLPAGLKRDSTISVDKVHVAASQ